MMADTTADPHLGRVVAGYRIEERIGRGGMGLVYRAEHLNLRRRAAIKIIAPELAETSGFRERFNREARIAAALQHPNIVTVYDAGEEDGLLYLAMQYIEGSDLAAVLRSQGRLRPYRALDVCRQVAAALDAAHGQGLIHRDVKPANVLIEGRTAFLTDFGLTKRIEGTQTQLTKAGDVVGTIHYVAPEQIEGGRVDARTDIYSLGCLLYHCLSGELPVRARHRRRRHLRAPLRGPAAAHVRAARAARRPGRGDRQGAREGAGAPLPVLRRPDVRRALGDRRGRPARRHRDAAARARVRRPLRRADDDRRRPARRRAAGDSPSMATSIGRVSGVAGHVEAARRPRVLLAGVDANTRAVTRVAVGERVDVEEAPPGESLIETVRDGRPDLVILDWNAPGPAGARGRRRAARRRRRARRQGAPARRPQADLERRRRRGGGRRAARRAVLAPAAPGQAAQAAGRRRRRGRG